VFEKTETNTTLLGAAGTTVGNTTSGPNAAHRWKKGQHWGSIVLKTKGREERKQPVREQVILRRRVCGWFKGAVRRREGQRFLTTGAGQTYPEENPFNSMVSRSRLGSLLLHGEGGGGGEKRVTGPLRHPLYSSSFSVDEGGCSRPFLLTRRGCHSRNYCIKN